MSEDFELECSVREDLGKGASRRLRRLDGSIPAVLYGGKKDPVSLTIAHKDIAKATENEAFFSHIITLNIDSKKEPAVIKALQRHPAKPFILHADFQRVDMKQEIQVKVPIHFINEDKCVGVKLQGGSIRHTLNEIEIVCLPKDLPEFIEVDMENVELGVSVHLSDLTFPEGVRSVALSVGEESDLNVASVQQPRGGAEEEEAAAEEGEAAEGEAPAEGDGDSGGEESSGDGDDA
ncbi:MAG: 50S ribosomal protein L25/general stress protein Ctc [Gammaproteobacteria bacterium]|nr:50S ribosomal protein L25/general stress protein Ctc [Gammaproteobacteria bacterium]